MQMQVLPCFFCFLDRSGWRAVKSAEEKEEEEEEARMQAR